MSLAPDPARSEATCIDPQARLLLESIFCLGGAAARDAARTGVYVGCMYTGAPLLCGVRQADDGVPAGDRPRRLPLQSTWTASLGRPAWRTRWRAASPARGWPSWWGAPATCLATGGPASPPTPPAPPAWWRSPWRRRWAASPSSRAGSSRGCWQNSVTRPAFAVAQGVESRTTSCGIAAGVNIMLIPQTTSRICLLQALSPEGRCKTFNADANGYGERGT